MVHVNVFAESSIYESHRSALVHALYEALDYRIADCHFDYFSKRSSAESGSLMIVEVTAPLGRNTVQKSRLVESIKRRIAEALPLTVDALEVTVFSTARENWGLSSGVDRRWELRYRVAQNSGEYERLGDGSAA